MPSSSTDDPYLESVYSGKRKSRSGFRVANNCASWLTCIVVTLILLTIWAILGLIAAVIITVGNAISGEFGDLEQFLRDLTNNVNSIATAIPQNGK